MIRRPLNYLAVRIGFELGRTPTELLDTITPYDFKQCVAYYSLQDEEYKKDIEHAVSMEEQKNKTQEELAKQMRAMLLGLQK